MITVATFSKPEEAHLLRMRLEAGGVTAFVQDEYMVQMDWLYSNAIGGVRIQIAEEDVEAAKEILNDEPIQDSDPNMAKCPKCGSTDSAPDELARRLAFLSLMLLKFPFLFLKSRWKCNSCHHVWNEPKAIHP
jgi:Zn finger protein HypA/HybF involved in hydrogenase expression